MKRSVYILFRNTKIFLIWCLKTIFIQKYRCTVYSTTRHAILYGQKTDRYCIRGYSKNLNFFSQPASLLFSMRSKLSSLQVCMVNSNMSLVSWDYHVPRKFIIATTNLRNFIVIDLIALVLKKCIRRLDCTCNSECVISHRNIAKLAHLQFIFMKGRKLHQNALTAKMPEGSVVAFVFSDVSSIHRFRNNKNIILHTCLGKTIQQRSGHNQTEQEMLVRLHSESGILKESFYQCFWGQNNSWIWELTLWNLRFIVPVSRFDWH